MEDEVHTNESIKDIRETRNELNRKKQTSAPIQKDRDMTRRLFEDCNKKQKEEIECRRREYKNNQSE